MKSYALTAPSGPILSLNVTVLTHEDVFVNWVEPRSEDQNGIITGYTINVTRNDIGATVQIMSTTTNTYLSSLQPFTTYTCEVAAMTIEGTGPFSSSIIFTTEQTGRWLFDKYSKYNYCLLSYFRTIFCARNF